MPSKKGVSPVGNAVSGALAGMTAVSISYPFDLIKTRTHFEVGSSKSHGVAAHNNKPAPRISSVARMIWKEGVSSGGSFGGFRSFYRGIDQLMPEAAFVRLN